MEKGTKIAVGFIIGLVGAWTFLAPVHEAGHVIAAILTGETGYIASWNLAKVSRHTVPIILGGPLTEMVFWAYFTRIALRRKRWISLGVGWAVVLTGYLATPITTDITDLARITAVEKSTWQNLWWIIMWIPITVIPQRRSQCRTNPVVTNRTGNTPRSSRTIRSTIS